MMLEYSMSLEIIVTIVGVLMSLAYFPQAFRIIKRKSASDVSLFSYIIFSIGTLTWTIYGLHIEDVVVVVSFTVGILGSWTVLFLKIFYNFKKDLQNEHKSN